MGAAEPGLTDDINTVLGHAAQKKRTYFRPVSDIALRLMFSYEPSDLEPQKIAALIEYLSQEYNIEIQIAEGGYGCTFLVANIKKKDELSPDTVSHILQDPRAQQLMAEAGIELTSISLRYAIQAVQRELSSNVFYMSNRDDISSSRTSSSLKFGKIKVFGSSGNKLSDDAGVRTGLLKAFWRTTSTLLLGHEKKEVRLGDAFEYEDDKEFIDTLRMRCPIRGSTVLYVHGYNSSFDDAVRALTTLYLRAGLARFDIVPVLFAWPSLARVHMYTSDIQKAKNSQLDLLEAVAVCMHCSRTHVLAHSHGASLLVDALSLSDNRLKQMRDPPIDQMIFVAPDVDKLLFEQRKHHVVGSCTRSTIYVSSGDLALRLSSVISSGERLGGVVGAGDEKIDIIDVAPARSSELMEHSHHLNVSEVAYDISEVLRGKVAHDRGPWLQVRSPEKHVYRLIPANMQNALT